MLIPGYQFPEWCGNVTSGTVGVEKVPLGQETPNQSILAGASPRGQTVARKEKGTKGKNSKDLWRSRNEGIAWGKPARKNRD